MFIPILYVIVRAAQSGIERWMRLLDTRVPELLWSTLTMTLTVTLMAGIIGVVLAWLVNRTDLPGRRFWSWVLALPLVIPPYVGAISYIIIFGPRGLLHDWLGNPLFDLFTFGPTAFVLTGFTYPYVYLIVSAALKRMNTNFEEAARCCGLNAGKTFLKVILPALRPAIGAGSILVALYILSDFGAVAMMRYPTFTAAIYFQMGSFDRSGAAILSFILIAITLVFLWLESKSREKMKFYQTERNYRTGKIYGLGRWKWPALVLVNLAVFSFVVLPLGVIAYWGWIGIAKGVLDVQFFRYMWNSFSISALAAVICMLLSLPLIYLKSRYPSRLSLIVDKISYAGYALPGVIVALGVVFVYIKYIPFLYGTAAMLITAYILRFLPQAMQAGDSAMSLISPRLDEAALSLGKRPWQVIIQVIIPLVKPGVLAGGALVFVSSIKELPATLLLRPAGLDTLAVRIWIEASEGFYELAAPSALLILLVSILPLRWVLSKY
ncbi:iron(III) transport system permease protein [Desulfohalotomaculum tongense]|uniref:ABC transporter permease n=1 Tax=Desulforadius tongensis TaxID=1216062 RepID=UPI00195BD457|nr:iron ABC transporter permease [Desulforadius tongensis]MBM7855652.1 iron(III) transport system permease protein [Desulforadius tongensis]